MKENVNVKESGNVFWQSTIENKRMKKKQEQE